MTTCEYCDSVVDSRAGTCPHCGAPIRIKAHVKQESAEEAAKAPEASFEQNEQDYSDTIKTVLSAAGGALGGAFISNLLRRQTRHNNLHGNRPPIMGGMRPQRPGGRMVGFGGNRGFGGKRSGR